MSTPHKYKLYYLVDPETKEIRYVGVTSVSLEKRLRGHISKSRIYRLDRKGLTHKAGWILSLKRKGLKPEINLLQSFANEQDCFDAERYWVDYFRNVGCDLTNSCAGGRGLFSPSESTRQKIRESVLANPTKGGCKKIIDNFGNIYESSAEASRKLNINYKVISEILCGVKRHYNGYTFSFYSNETSELPIIRSKIKPKAKRIVDHLGNIFDSVNAATMHYKFKSHKSISNVLTGRSKTAGGMTFKYLIESI